MTKTKETSWASERIRDKIAASKRKGIWVGSPLALGYSIAREAGRDPANLTGSMYLTLSLDDNADRAHERMNKFLEQYYN